jgi:hypothetical protein
MTVAIVIAGLALVGAALAAVAGSEAGSVSVRRLVRAPLERLAFRRER